MAISPSYAKNPSLGVQPTGKAARGWLDYPSDRRQHRAVGEQEGSWEWSRLGGQHGQEIAECGGHRTDSLADSTQRRASIASSTASDRANYGAVPSLGERGCRSIRFGDGATDGRSTPRRDRVPRSAGDGIGRSLATRREI